MSADLSTQPTRLLDLSPERGTEHTHFVIVHQWDSGKRMEGDRPHLRGYATESHVVALAMAVAEWNQQMVAWGHPEHFFVPYATALDTETDR